MYAAPAKLVKSELQQNTKFTNISGATVVGKILDYYTKNYNLYEALKSKNSYEDGELTGKELKGMRRTKPSTSPSSNSNMTPTTGRGASSQPPLITPPTAIVHQPRNTVAVVNQNIASKRNRLPPSSDSQNVRTGTASRVLPALTPVRPVSNDGWREPNQPLGTPMNPHNAGVENRRGMVPSELNISNDVRGTTRPDYSAIGARRRREMQYADLESANNRKKQDAEDAYNNRRRVAWEREQRLKKLERDPRFVALKGAADLAKGVGNTILRGFQR